MKFDKLKPNLQELNLNGVKKAASRVAHVRIRLSRGQWIAFHPARPRPREPGHPADQLAFSAFMSNSMRRSSVNATICSTTATFPPSGTGPVKFAISVQAPRPGACLSRRRNSRRS